MKTNFLKTVKNILQLALVLTSSLIFVNCDKDDPAPIVPLDTKLVLPATLTNATVFNIPDAVIAAGSCGINASPGTAISSIDISADGIIVDASKVSIQIDLAHTYCGEIVVELIAPNGESCGLIKRIGATSDTSCGSSAAFIAGNKLTFNTTFNNTLIGNPIGTGDYAQLQGTSTFPSTVPMTSIGTFLTGKNIKGVWKIKIYDCGNGYFGKLNEWKLILEAGALQ